jgi:hypothetical protein
MTLVESGADILISEFGETVRVYEHQEQQPENSSDPIYFEDQPESTSYTEHRVRLYTTPSDEMLADYGFDEDTEAICYNREKIAELGDRISYPGTSQEWIVDQFQSNQLGSGPYLFVFSMKEV